MREIYDLIKKTGIFFVIGKGDKRTNPIHNNDLAIFCIESIIKDNFEASVGGPKIYTRKEVAQIAFKSLTKKPKIISIPTSLSTLSNVLLKPFDFRLIAMSCFYIEAMKIDLVAPAYGTKTLESYFDKLKNK